jgi:hypothetical protein
MAMTECYRTARALRREPPPNDADYALPVDGDLAATERHRTARSVSLGMVGGVRAGCLADRRRLDSSQGVGETGSIFGCRAVVSIHCRRRRCPGAVQTCWDQLRLSPRAVKIRASFTQERSAGVLRQASQNALHLAEARVERINGLGPLGLRQLRSHHLTGAKG